MKILISIIFILWSPCVVFADSIVNSKHNLSVGGPGEIKATQESQVCIFCHAPHNASALAPLWNRYDSGQIYTPYKTSTLKAKVGQPTGASKLCLSCHDGTVALGMVRSRSATIPFTRAIEGDTKLGTDLTNDHPVSFRYDSSLASANGQLKDPSTLTGAVRLDKDANVQCITCHEPHDNQNRFFLRVDDVRGNLCLLCHDLNGWNGASHKNSNATWNGVSPNPWGWTPWNNVSDTSCRNCHAPHGGCSNKFLLKSGDICRSCHNGNVAGKNVIAEFDKLSAHPGFDEYEDHDPAENVLVTSKRHGSCQDCHNSHAASGVPVGSLPGSLRGLKGVNAQGSTASPITYEYELCFRCHADSNYAQKNYAQRQFAENNTRIEFDPANSSFHPLENIGKNPDVPSLINPWTASSLVKCTDCHNNNNGPGAGGTGSKGPHGSAYSPILERNLNFSDNQSESASTYALCYKCHDRNSILANNSFPYHNKHISEVKSPCTACHDSHGVKTISHLINFDRNIVSENSSGQLSFTDSGRYRGSCSLKCHSVEHNARSY